MTSDARSVARGAPASLRDWAVVLRHAAVTMGRATAIIVAIYILALVIGDASIYFQAGGIVVGIACLYLALGAGARVWAFYIVAFVVFAQLRALADETGVPVQYSYPIQAEKAIFLGTLPTLWLQDAFYSQARLGILELYTMSIYISYFFVPHAAALALWRWDRARFNVYLPAFVMTLYIGLAVALAAPTAPPWLASEAGMIPSVHRIIPDIMDNLAPGAYQQGESTAGTNLVAAMPSLHAAVPWLMAIVCWRYRWYIRWLSLAYAASMTFAIVYLGEHYFVDALAGLVVAAASWLAAPRILSWWAGLRDSSVSEASAPGVLG